MTNDALFDTALQYERAVTRMTAVITRLRNEHKADPDTAFDIMIEDLTALRQRYQNLSDLTWVQAEPTEKREPWFDLANGIVMQQISDYERALCDSDNGTKARVRAFARSDWAATLTKLDVPSMLKQIDAAYKDFVIFVKDHGAGIVAETKRLRAKKKQTSESKYRCPLCGGGLYEYSPTLEKTHRIKCSGCPLTGVWKEPRYDTRAEN